MRPGDVGEERLEDVFLRDGEEEITWSWDMDMEEDEASNRMDTECRRTTIGIRGSI